MAERWTNATRPASLTGAFPRQQKAQVSSETRQRTLCKSEVEVLFRDFLREQDVEPAGYVTIVADGRRRGYDISGDSRGSKKAWYTLYADGVPNGRVGCQKRFGDDVRRWKASCRAAPMTAEEWRRRDQESRQRKEADAKAEKVKHDGTAERANKIWASMRAATSDHPYLQRKRVQSHSLRMGAWEKFDRDAREYQVVCENALILPMQNAHGEIRNLQAIFPAKLPAIGRDKDFLPGGEKNGLFFPIGAPSERDSTATIVIGEGYATCATLFEAAGHYTVVAFDCGNLIHVARILRRANRRAAIVIAADDDIDTPGNPGLTAARKAAAAVGGAVVVPQFNDRVCVRDRA
jgi:putative DNA primase/helicase